MGSVEMQDHLVSECAWTLPVTSVTWFSDQGHSYSRHCCSIMLMEVASCRFVWIMSRAC